MQTFQKIIKILLLVIIFAILLIFAMYNNQQTNHIRFLDWQTPESPVWILVFISIIIGLVLGMAITTSAIISANQEKRQAHRELKKVKAELNRMRNVSIDDDTGEKPEPANDESQADN